MDTEGKILRKKDEQDDLRAQITQDVMKMVQEELNKIKPSLISSIKEEVIKELSQTGSQSVQHKNKDDGWHIVDGTGRLDNKYMPRVLQGFHYDGWIYYVNRQNGKFLYKVREDRTDNRQLTDYTVNVDPDDFSVRNGDVYIDGYKIKIKL
ncbi:hypothetical protein [Subdoligranulum variabile]|nr:hypothetical protein [Subdoligranulum variabile]UWP69554.1 hypothetical protein NQ490_06820 [Subdoligranulum variabile]